MRYSLVGRLVVSVFVQLQLRYQLLSAASSPQQLPSSYQMPPVARGPCADWTHFAFMAIRFFFQSALHPNMWRHRLCCLDGALRCTEICQKCQKIEKLEQEKRSKGLKKAGSFLFLVASLLLLVRHLFLEAMHLLLIASKGLKV